MRARLEMLLLVVLLLAAAAFIVSFALGWRPRAAAPAHVTQATQPATVTAPSAPAAGQRPRVEVLNGSGTAGLARTATEQLRAGGFDVVYFGNAAEPRKGASVVIDRVGRLSDAQAIARALRITNVTTELDSSRLVEASVILGKGWPPDSAR